MAGSPLLPAITSSRDTNSLPASFLKLMSCLTLASPLGKLLPEPCCLHGYKLLSFPASVYLWMTRTHLALFFLYQHWLLARMAPFPALVFILWQALPSAVGLPTLITQSFWWSMAGGGVRASRLPHFCSGDSPSDLICSSPIQKENLPCSLSASSLGMVPVCRRTTSVVPTTDKGSPI